MDRLLMRVVGGVLQASAAAVLSAPGDTVFPRAFVESEPARYAVPAGEFGGTYVAGNVRVFEGLLYRCLQPHTVTDPNWTPVKARSLWTRFYEIGEIPPWVQPTGSSDAWPLGAKVTHRGNTWESLVANNVWEPGATGTETLWRCLDCAPPATPEWVSGEQLTYSATNPIYRTYQGRKYQLRQNPGVNIWPPPTVPALWLDVGPA